MLTLMKAESMIDQVFEQIKGVTASLAPPHATDKIQASLMDLVRARMSWDKLRPEYVRIYSETFSEAEIDGMLAFYETPAGRAMLEKMPLLLSKTMTFVQSQMAGLMPEIERIVKESAPK